MKTKNEFITLLLFALIISIINVGAKNPEKSQFEFSDMMDYLGNAFAVFIVFSIIYNFIFVVVNRLGQHSHS